MLAFCPKWRVAEHKLNKFLLEKNDPLTINAIASNGVIEDDPSVRSVDSKVLDESLDDTDLGGDTVDALDDHISDSDAKYLDYSKIDQNLTNPFLKHLNDEDRIVDGTIRAIGVLKLQKLYPAMKTLSWTDCLYNCEKCNQTFQGKTKASEIKLMLTKFNSFPHSIQQGPHNFYAHNTSKHFDEVQSMEFACYYCRSKHKREYTLSPHMAQEHFTHLKFW